ncbi:MAG: hypothetical protein J0L67_18860 [Cytophagales bacterium]|nr:hypothetical protein [Cytophagales bacterium]
MKANSILLFIFLVLVCASCSKESRFPTDKRYWDSKDYGDVILKIGYGTPDGEEFPRFSNPETGIVIRKLLDAENYRVIIEDPELGLNYRNEEAEKFFNHYRDLAKTYSIMDVQDKFVYAEELAEILKFGLHLQIVYFKLGNERIVAQSDSPDSKRIQDIVRSNETTAVKNFNVFLDQVNNEKSYGEYASLLADGINEVFPKLISNFPKANYSSMKSKAELMLNKSQNEKVKTALTSLIERLKGLSD